MKRERVSRVVIIHLIVFMLILLQLMLYNEIIGSCYPGAFHLLPLGQRAMDKLTRIIDQEMEAVGGQKISMPTLAPDFLWKASGWFHRFHDYIHIHIHVHIVKGHREKCINHKSHQRCCAVVSYTAVDLDRSV